MSTSPFIRPRPVPPRPAPPAASRASQEGRSIPFDYAFRFRIGSETDPAVSSVNQTLTNTVTVSTEASFVAVSIGYGLLPFLNRVPFGPQTPADLEVASVGTITAPPLLASGAPAPTPLSALFEVASFRLPTSLVEAITDTPVPPSAAALATAPAGLVKSLVAAIPPRRVQFGEIANALSRTLGEGSFVARGQVGPRTAAALLQGIRLNPSAMAELLLSDGQESLTEGQLAEMFETIPVPPEGAIFLYALTDQASGRSFQSEPLLSIAGLGIDNGDRPFRRFSPPIRFAPRSVIRMDVTPKSNFRGELQVVLQGYKTLGEPGTPTGRKLRGRTRGARR